MWCTKITLILLFFELHSSLQHSLAKVAVNNDTEIFEIKELPDNAVEFINTKPDEPTVREIIYYHIVEKPYKEVQETAKNEEVSTVADKTNQILVPSSQVDQSTRPFTNGQGFQFFDSHSEETDPVQKIDDTINKSSDRRGIQDGENSNTIQPSHDSRNKNSVEDITKKQDINGRSLGPTKDEEKKKVGDITTAVPAIIDEKEKPIKSRRKREIRLGNLPQSPSLPDFGLSGLPDYIQNIYKASPDFSKYFGSNNGQVQSNPLYQPSINNEGNVKENPEYQRNSNYIPSKTYNPLNNVVYTNNDLNNGYGQFKKNNNNKKSNPILDIFNNIPNLLMRRGKEPTYGMDLHGGKGSVWDNLAQQPFVNENIGNAFTQPRPKKDPEQIENHKRVKTNIKSLEGISSNEPEKKSNDNINPKSNNNEDLPYFTDSGVEIPPAPKILEPRNDEAENVDSNANTDSLPNSSLNSLKINKLKNNQEKITSSNKYRDNLRTNLNQTSNNKVNVNPDDSIALDNNYKNSTKKAYMNKIKKSINKVQKKMSKPLKENLNNDLKQDKNPAFVNKNNIINDDNNAYENNLPSIPRKNALSAVPNLEQTSKPQFINRKSSIEANNNNVDNNSDDKNNKDTDYNKIKKSFENLLNKLTIFKPLSSKISENGQIIKENRPPSDKNVPFESKINPTLVNSHDDESQSETTTEGKTESLSINNENSVKNNTLRENNTDKIEKSFDDIDKLMHSLTPNTKQGPAVQGTYGMRLAKDNGYVWNDLNPKHETFIHVDQTTTEDVKKSESGLSTESSVVTTLPHDDIESNAQSNVHTNKYVDITTKPIVEIITNKSEQLNTASDKSSTIKQLQTTTEMIPAITSVETKEDSATTEPSNKANLTTIISEIPSNKSEVTSEANIQTTIAVNGEDLKKTNEGIDDKNIEITTEPMYENITSTENGVKSNKDTTAVEKSKKTPDTTTDGTTSAMPTTINAIQISKDKEFENTTINHFDETTDKIKSTPKNTTDQNYQIESTTAISENISKLVSNEHSDNTNPNTNTYKNLENNSKNTKNNKIVAKKHNDKSIKSDLNKLLKKKEFWDWLSGWTSIYIKDFKKYTKEIVKEEVAAQIKNITHSWNGRNETNILPANVSKPISETQIETDLKNRGQKDEQNTIIPEKSEDYTENKTNNNIKNTTSVYPHQNNEIKTEPSSTEKLPIYNSDLNVAVNTELTTNFPESTETTSVIIKKENETGNNQHETNKDMKIPSEIKKEKVKQTKIANEKPASQNDSKYPKDNIISTTPNSISTQRVTSTRSPKDSTKAPIVNNSMNSEEEEKSVEFSTTETPQADNSTKLNKLTDEGIVDNINLNKQVGNATTEFPEVDNTTKIPTTSLSPKTEPNNSSEVDKTNSPPADSTTTSKINDVLKTTTEATQDDNSTKLNALTDKATASNVNLNDEINNTTTEASHVENSTISIPTSVSPKIELNKINNSSAVNNSTETPAESTTITISKFSDETKTSTTEAPNDSNSTNVKTTTEKSTESQPDINTASVNKTNLSENLKTEIIKVNNSSSSTESTKTEDAEANSTLKEHPSTESSLNENSPKLNNSMTPIAPNTSEKTEITVANNSKSLNTSIDSQPDKNITNINNTNTAGTIDSTKKATSVDNYTDIANTTETTKAKNSIININVTTEIPKIENSTIPNDKKHIKNNTNSEDNTDEKVTQATTPVNNTESTTLKDSTTAANNTKSTTSKHSTTAVNSTESTTSKDSTTAVNSTESTTSKDSTTAVNNTESTTSKDSTTAVNNTESTTSKDSTTTEDGKAISELTTTSNPSSETTTAKSNSKAR